MKKEASLMQEILAMKAQVVGKDKKKKNFDKARALAAAIAYKKAGK